MVLFYSMLLGQIFDDLKANTHVIANMDYKELPLTFEEQLGEDGLRITLVDSDGTVLYDSVEDAANMENHAGRPEIKEALETGEGRGMRKSATLAKHTFYYAMKLSDGTVLRVGKSSAGSTIWYGIWRD